MQEKLDRCRGTFEYLICKSGRTQWSFSDHGAEEYRVLRSGTETIVRISGKYRATKSHCSDFGTAEFVSEIKYLFLVIYLI